MAVDLDDGRFVAGEKPADTRTDARAPGTDARAPGTDARAPGRDTQVPGQREVIVTAPRHTERREAREYVETHEPLERREAREQPERREREETREYVETREPLERRELRERPERREREETREHIDTRSPTEAGFASVAYAALRITTGVILAAHGFNKLLDFPAWTESVRSLKLFGMGIPLPTTMAALSLLVEFGGGIALILGLFTRLASLGVFVNMLVAILTVHAGHGLYAQNGGYEFPLLLLMASVLFFADGSGRYGIDSKLFHALRERRAARRERRPHLGPHYAH